MSRMRFAKGWSGCARRSAATRTARPGVPWRKRQLDIPMTAMADNVGLAMPAT